jgi:cyclophilin family peptidyl-prolyl cis-trans isomerase
MRRLFAATLVTFATAFGAACGGPPPPRYPMAEAARRSTEWLLADADTAGSAGRVRALHALGRIGDEAAVAKLEATLASAKDEAVGVAAVEGLWFAEAGSAAVAAAFGGDAAADPKPLLDVAVVRALGRLAGAAEMGVVERALGDGRPEVRAAAGIAAGVAGRRKVAYTAGIRAALVRGLDDPIDAVRVGAAYGLATDPAPARDPEILARLAAVNGPAEARALAMKALGQRGAAALALVRGLDDADVWTRVEAVRALSDAKGTPEMRTRLAAWLEAQWSDGVRGAELHPVLEALTRLAPSAGERAIADAFQHIHDAVPRTPRMGADAVQCLTAAGLVRQGTALEMLVRCGGSPADGWPLWARRQLLAQAVKDGAGTATERRAALTDLAADPDERVRAAVPDAAAALLPDGDAEKVLRAALADRSVAVAESACDALGGLGDKAPAWAAAALLQVAPRSEREPELRQSLLEALAAIKADAPAVFEKALSDPSPAVRKKAADGLQKLGRKVPARTAETLPLPPISLEAAAGHPTLVVTTTQGMFHVELAPDAAPWNVATLVTLASRHFFDGTFWHRVVPGFVVQGGDPTGTGAGGPGFSVIEEPSALPYARGAVGIADAGKDTGGSQWFVMHAPAPHLDGRYTVVGNVPSADMEVVDRLIVGDRILRIEVAR